MRSDKTSCKLSGLDAVKQKYYDNIIMQDDGGVKAVEKIKKSCM